MDILWSFAGPVAELKHHRGITHTFIAAPVVAGVIVGLVYLLDMWVKKRRLRKRSASADADAPILSRRSQCAGAGFTRRR